MEILLHLLFLLVSFAILIKGADYFVEAASKIAKHFGISEFIIGLTLVAIGTSLPELASSIAAVVSGAPDIVIGNIVGSNIANIALIVGLAAVLMPIAIRKEMIHRDGFFMLFVTVLLLILSLDGTLSFVDALVLILIYIFYSLFLIESTALKESDNNMRYFTEYVLKFGYFSTLKNVVKKKEKPKEKKDTGLLKNFGVLLLSGVAIVFGARFLINEALYFAGIFSTPEVVVGITIIAIGTSLPELMVTVSAARQGYGNIALGNVIGSNIANILIVGGLSALFAPLIVATSSLMVYVPIMIAVTVLLLIFMRTKMELSRLEGWTFLAIYVLFIGSSIVLG